MKISVKGVAIGSIIDIVSSSLAGVPLVMYVSAAHPMVGLPKEQASAELMRIIHADPALVAAQYAIGGVCSILGGYVAARIAKVSPEANGALSSVLCVSGGLFSLATSPASAPLRHISALILSPILGFIGGRAYALRSKSNAA